MRSQLIHLTIALAATAIAGESQAVALYQSATRNTTAPTGTFSNSGWQYQMKVGNFLGTPIGPHTFLIANHIAPGTGTTFTWNSTTYTVNGGTLIPGTDLAVRTVNNAFPTFAPVYNPTVDGSLPGKTITIFGRGTQRGAEIHLATAPRAGESTLRGWEWGTFDSVQSWGTNTLDGFIGDGGSPTELIRFDFSDNGTTEEGTVTSGDSGGGVFAKSSDGIWKLVGINYSVDCVFRLSETGSDIYGSYFDVGNMYQFINAQSPIAFYPDEVDDLAAEAYSTNVTNYLTQLASYIPKPGDATLDGKVNALDFNQLAGHFGTSSVNWADGDFNHDGLVNSTDFNLLMSNYGYHGTPPAAVALGGAVVPEPATLGLLLMGLPLLLRRRQF